MGALANGALEAGGDVVGVIPRFMTEVEWQHPGVANLEVVEDMRERKHRLLTGSDAVVALPGGCGTLEELFEAMTLKRLALYFNPIVLLDTNGFYKPLDAFLSLVHEAVHVWQFICQHIGEQKPGIEMEAYGIEGITRGLIEAYFATQGKGKDWL